MSFYTDIKCDALAIWSTSGWATRTILAFSLFFTTSSIASLSDTVFKWRGFFLTAKQAYHEHVIGPFVELAQSLGLSITSDEADGFIIITVLISSNVRAITKSHKGELGFGNLKQRDVSDSREVRSGMKEAEEQSEDQAIASYRLYQSAIDRLTVPEKGQRFFWGALAFLFYAFFFYIAGSDFDHGHELFIGFAGIYALIFLDLLLMCARVSKLNRTNVNVAMRRKLVLFVSVPALSIFLVCISAAINLGFERPL